jgi:hypothetical protein
MFNMNMFFDFVTIVLNNHMFKIDISRIHWNTNKGHNLQSRLQINEILDFFDFQINGALECTCKLSYFYYYYQNASKL